MMYRDYYNSSEEFDEAIQEADARIEKGLSYLIQEYGHGFQVDCTRLDMRLPNACVIGQLEEGGYSHWLARVRERHATTTDMEAQLGVDHAYTSTAYISYGLLTERWKLALEAGGHCSNKEA